MSVARANPTARPAAPATRGTPAAGARRAVRTRTLAAWLFTAPGLLAQLFFGWLPILFAFVIAFQRHFIAREPQYVGLQNFKEVWSDALVATAFANTLYYAALSIGLTFFVPILVSILLMEMSRRAIRWMMVLWFIPVASTAGITIVKYMYHPKLGLLTGLFEKFGLTAPKFLDDPRWAMLSLVLPGIVMFGPGLIYVAALQNVPEELYEAAELEGAGFWRKVRVVTLPRLRPVIAMMLIFSVIGSMQVFELPFIMTQGGPGYSTTTVVMLIYDTAFKAYNLGKATAMAVLLFFIIMALIALQRRYFRENIDAD